MSMVAIIPVASIIAANDLLNNTAGTQGKVPPRPELLFRSRLHRTARNPRRIARMERSRI